MKISELKEYLDLMERFQTGQIDALSFERDYLTTFKAERRHFPKHIYSVLNELFSDVDAYVTDSTIRNSKDLDEAQLLECCKAAHAKLLKSLTKHS